jgi:hypothetical protein
MGLLPPQQQLRLKMSGASLPGRLSWGVKLNRKIIMAAALAVATTSIATPAYAEKQAKPVELSATELAAAQSKSFAIPASAAFSATLATLQSLGYIDINASKDAGTISAQTEAKGKIFYNILWGFGKKKLTQKASLLIEENGPSASLVRLNLHVSETKARGIFGTSFSDGKLVKTAEPYATFFTALEAEVARRAVPAGTVSATSAPVVAPATGVTPN